MSGESGNLVAHAFGGGYGDFIDYALVGVEVECEAWVVLFDDGACGFLYCFGTDSHFDLFSSLIDRCDGAMVIKTVEDGG